MSQLPPWPHLIRDAIDDVRTHGRELMDKARNWVFAAIGANLAGGIMLGGALSSGASGLAFLGIVLLALAAISACALAVLWHRRFILNEPFDLAGRSIGGLAAAYLFQAFLIGLLASVPLSILIIGLIVPIFGAFGLDANNSWLFGAAVTFLYALALASLCMRLPSLAIEKPTTLAGAWQMIGDGRWQLAIAFFAVDLPALIVSQMLSIDPEAAAQGEVGTGFTVLLMIVVIFNVAAALLSVAIATRAYINLQEKPPLLTSA